MLADGGNANNRYYIESGWVSPADVLLLFFFFRFSLTMDQFAVVKLNN